MGKNIGFLSIFLGCAWLKSLFSGSQVDLNISNNDEMRTRQATANSFIGLPPNTLPEVLSYCDYKTISSLHETNKGIREIMNNYGRTINQKQREFFLKCEEKTIKTGNCSEDTMNFIHNMEKLIKSQPIEYKNILTSLFLAYCNKEDFKNWYARKMVLKPIFMKLFSPLKTESWEDKYIKIFNISLLKKSTYIFVLQFFLDRGVNIDCPVKYNFLHEENSRPLYEQPLISYFIDYPIEYKRLNKCTGVDTFKFLLNNGAKLNNALIGTLLKYCEFVISLEVYQYFESYANQYFSLYALFREKGVVFQETDKNKELFKKLEDFPKSRKRKSVVLDRQS